MMLTYVYSSLGAIVSEINMRHNDVKMVH